MKNTYLSACFVFIFLSDNTDCSTVITTTTTTTTTTGTQSFLFPCLFTGDDFVFCCRSLALFITHLSRSICMFTEARCPAYKAFPVGVEGGKADPCKPAANFQLSSSTDHACSLQCKSGYEQRGGTGVSTLQCKKDGKLTGALTCTGTHR